MESAKEQAEWENKLALASSEAYKSSKELSETKHHFSLKRVQLQQQVSDLKEELLKVQAYKNDFELHLCEIAKEEAELSCQMMEKQGQKTVLASEQLAVMKKSPSRAAKAGRKN